MSNTKKPAAHDAAGAVGDAFSWRRAPNMYPTAPPRNHGSPRREYDTQGAHTSSDTTRAIRTGACAR